MRPKSILAALGRKPMRQCLCGQGVPLRSWGSLALRGCSPGCILDGEVSGLGRGRTFMREKGMRVQATLELALLADRFRVGVVLVCWWGEAGTSVPLLRSAPQLALGIR